MIMLLMCRILPEEQSILEKIDIYDPTSTSSCNHIEDIFCHVMVRLAV